MLHKNVLLLLLEKVTEVSERTARIESEQVFIKEDLENIKEQDLIQNKLLAEHIRGVQTANLRLDNEIESRKLMQETQTTLTGRVSTLEEAPKFRANLKQYIVGIGAIAAAIVAIFKFLKAIGY